VNWNTEWEVLRLRGSNSTLYEGFRTHEFMTGLPVNEIGRPKPMGGMLRVFAAGALVAWCAAGGPKIVPGGTRAAARQLLQERGQCVLCHTFQGASGGVTGRPGPIDPASAATFTARVHGQP